MTQGILEKLMTEVSTLDVARKISLKVKLWGTAQGAEKAIKGLWRIKGF
jgi:hypothetical protein